ncbi:glutamyl-tRNA reductase [Thermosulfurimonas sp. F29]|uniref:glutamyl-tRNA reductase n=1 Tax=Thermosulfurimonas sp. F29 TaxID=2867247 RepID=UPI001C835CB0|nr:glutamyl-tRNA reductase [Thermosulfurimonas sp. F29]MBX6423687.1 glutamyl-tRNA reductase [Thermosulfurimonas sp. F29]
MEGGPKEQILLVGLNHRTAPVEVRERFALDKKGGSPLEILRENLPGANEVFFLSTCNRVEFLLISEDPEGVLENLKAILSRETGLSREEFEPHLYVMRNMEAVRHLFRVASGLDSLVLGEPQILGQVKEAYREAAARRTTGPILNRLLHRTFSVAKRVRTETGIGSYAVSVSYAAVELAKKIFGSLKGKTALLVGAGEMAELAAQHLLGAGVERMLVANRTLARAVELAERFRGEAYSLEELTECLLATDIVISSTGAPGYVITRDMVKPLLRKRRLRPLFFIDIAVPRDVEPAVNDLENVYVFDIDDLKQVVEENLGRRRKEALRAERIIEEEVLKFERWWRELAVYPTIKALREKAEAIRRRELARTLPRLRDLSPEEREALEVMTEAIVQKLLHAPITYLKAGYHRMGREAITTVRRVFDLDGDLETLLTKEWPPEHEKLGKKS